MEMSDKTYRLMKWLIGIVLPAALTLFGVIGKTLEWPCTSTVMIIAGAVITFLGTITGISTVQYNLNKKNEELLSDVDSEEL